MPKIKMTIDIDVATAVADSLDSDLEFGQNWDQVPEEKEKVQNFLHYLVAKIQETEASESKNLTWEQLAEIIKQLPENARKTDVTFMTHDTEYFAVSHLGLDKDSGVLDSGHPILIPVGRKDPDE